MPTQIVESEIRELLAEAGGSYVAAFDQLVAREARKAVERIPRSTIDTRKAAWKVAIAKRNRTAMANMNKTLSGFTALVRRNSRITESEAPRILDDGEILNLTEEVLGIKKIKEIVDARYEVARQSFFGHFTESFAEQGEEFPEHVNGYVEVPELGVTVNREGTGRKDPVLDENVLAAQLGPELWSAVTDEQTTTVRVLDMDRLMKLANDQPAVLEKIRSALKVGDWKTPRFTVRDIKQEE